ncbi:SMI1/KNR4 family protein [Aquimarina sp. M1]
MNLEKAFEIIEKNIDESNFFGPIAKEKITSAENILNIKFPLSYKRFIEQYGSGDIFGLEFYGIIKDPKTDAHMIPNGIWLTQSLRNESNLLLRYLVIAETGYGPYYVLDTSEGKNNENQVYIWDIGNQVEEKFDNFGSFLFTLLEESM